MIEERFGPYTVYECIGAGGMATVHRATFDRGDGVAREVALKRLLPQHVDDKTFTDDFLREGQIASRLHHPGIVAILDLGRIGTTYFIAMELIAGQSMMQLIRKAHVAKKPAPIGVVIALISELCDALDYACNGNDTLGDRLNIIHRDLSPSNLLVADDGHLRVIDFGVAKAITGRFATTTGLVKGKLGYMSIEALTGKPLDGRADVFSTGVVAWELLTGRRLFTGANEMEIVQRVRTGVVQPPSSLNPACPPTLDAIVLQALARVRDDRWSTAAALRNALETIRRAYRDESTVGEVMRWREEIGAEAAPPRQTTRPKAKVPEVQQEDPDEVTQHRAMPTAPGRPKMKRAMTEIDLLDLEPAAPPPPRFVPEPSAAQTTFEARAYEPPDEDLAPGTQASASASHSFDFGGDAADGSEGPSQTFTGEMHANAFGGATAPTGTVPVPQWPVESATMLNIDPYAVDPPSSSYMDMVVSHNDEPEPEPEPEPEITFDRPLFDRPPLDETSPHETSNELEMLDLDLAPAPRDDILDLEAPEPAREELLDLEDHMTLDGLDPPTMRPSPDTVIVPSSGRRTRS